jgi:hypothetical protein
LRDDGEDWQTIAVEVPLFHRWFVMPGLGLRRAMIRRWPHLEAAAATGTRLRVLAPGWTAAPRKPTYS